MKENKYRAFLIKYAEIGLKGKNRRFFEDCLVTQIRTRLELLGEYLVTKEQGRVFVECPEDFDYEDTVAALKTVFGIASFSPVVIIDTIAWDTLLPVVGNYVDTFFPEKNFSFKVECKRGNKDYFMTSPQICVEVGEYLLKRFPELRVDVHCPQHYITVEVRNRAYVYSEVIAGPGGMPVGSSGKAMLLLSGGIDSPVAGYMISKRGVSLDAVYFHAPPYTSERAKQKVVDLAEIISAYTGPIRLHVVNFTDIQMYIYETCPHEELTILMRRYMMRIAETIAKETACLALVTGESIGQVASQTMQSLQATNAVCTMPVFRPLIGFDKQEIVEISEKIGTYETSILPYEDCCTIFVAKHPVTKPSIRVIERSEKLLFGKIEEMVDKALQTREVISVGNKTPE